MIGTVSCRLADTSIACYRDLSRHVRVARVRERGAAYPFPLPPDSTRREFVYRPSEVFVVVGCLALNASYEPLTMVPLRRALRLVIDGKAEIVEADSDRVVRSERLTMPRPAVIRLTKFIHVPRRFRRQVTNTFLFARDHYVPVLRPPHHGAQAA